jgi:hypothetical protein
MTTEEVLKDALKKISKILDAHHHPKAYGYGTLHTQKLNEMRLIIEEARKFISETPESAPTEAGRGEVSPAVLGLCDHCDGMG